MYVCMHINKKKYINTYINKKKYIHWKTAIYCLFLFIRNVRKCLTPSRNRFSKCIQDFPDIFPFYIPTIFSMLPIIPPFPYTVNMP